MLVIHVAGSATGKGEGGPAAGGQHQFNNVFGRVEFGKREPRATPQAVCGAGGKIAQLSTMPIGARDNAAYAAVSVCEPQGYFRAISGFVLQWSIFYP